MDQSPTVPARIAPYEPPAALQFTHHNRALCIPFDELEYLCKSGSRVYLYTATGCYVSDYSMTELLRMLPVNDFVQVTKSHIVSLPKVGGWQRTRVKVAGRWLPLSQYYRRQLLVRLGKLINLHVQTLFIATRP